MSEPAPRFPLPAPLVKAIAQARAALTALPRPARMVLLAVSLTAALYGGFTVFQHANEAYTPVFTQLDRDDASAIVAKLKEMKVPYHLEADGASIEVPESRVRELRLELAGAGLPRGGGVGFESFDKMKLGATDFEQRVLFRRALEGELVRTIGTLSSVESARVHLVLPERSVFVARNEPASASIVLRLRPARTLGPSEVAGIVHLVASAVPGLDADKITVVTTDGTMLHRPRRSGTDDLGGMGGDDDARAASHSYETSLEDRVRAMLERVVGAGHADVRVTAEIDPARVERTEDHFDPSRSVLRSEEQTIDRTPGQTEESVAGVPGAESNLPGGAGKPAASAAASASASAAPPAAASGLALAPTRETHTRNYEIDRVSEKRITGSGALRRLTVAVVLDGVHDGKASRPRAQEELDKLALLVRSAAGANDTRGDVVTVESFPFSEAPDALETSAPAAPLALGRLQLARKYAPAAAGAVLLLAIALVVWRRRRARVARAATVTQQLPAVAEVPALAAGPEANPALHDDLRTKALHRAEQDPATAALVVRFWLGTPAAEGNDLAST